VAAIASTRLQLVSASSYSLPSTSTCSADPSPLDNNEVKTYAEIALMVLPPNVHGSGAVPSTVDGPCAPVYNPRL
jgi:hypothetical protein